MKRIHSAVIAAAIITSLLPINAFAAAEITADADADSNGIKFDISSTDVNDVLTTFDISAGGGSLTVDLKEKLNPENIGSWSGSSIFKGGIKVKDVVGAGADAGDMDFSVGGKSYNLYNDYVGDKGTAEVKNDTFAQTICKDVGISGTLENGQFTRTDSNPMYSVSYNEATGALSVTDDINDTTAADVKIVVNGEEIDTSEKFASDGNVKVELNPVSGALLEEDFTNVTDAWGFVGAAGAAASNGVLSLCGSTNANSTTTTIKTMPDNVSGSDALNIKFDWASNVESGKDRSSGLELRDSDGVLLFAMYGKGGTKTDSGIKYAVAETDESISWESVEGHTSGVFYTIDLTVNFITGKIKGTITNTQTGAVLTTISETSTDAENFAQMKAGNYYSAAPMSLDNVSISACEKYKTTFAVTSDNGGASVGNAKIVIGKNEYTTNTSGVAVASLPAGSYDYTVTASGYKIYSDTVTVSADSSVSVTLEYVGVTNPQSIVISGGDDGIYKPASGENKTVNPYTAVVYDDAGQAMPAEEIEWSIDNIKTGLTGVSIENGIVTVTSDMPIVDNNGDELIIRAACKSDSTVTSTVTLHVYNVAEISDFDITGPAIIKDGTTIAYGVTDVKDQYGVAMTTDETPVITVDNKDIAVSGGNVTPSTGVNNEITATITVSLGNVSKSKNITVYGYDFYEPGIGEAFYCSPRMETINDQSMIVWPASQSAAATTEIVFPEPVQLANGTSKRFTFENIWTTQTVGSQERSFKLINSAGATVLYVGYAGGSVVTNPVSENGVFTAGDGGVTVGALGAANAVNTGSFVFKTDSDGNNSVVLQYNDSDPQTVALGQNLGDIAKIQLIGGRGAPDARLLSMTNIKFANSDVAEVEIVGDSYISKVYGATAAKTYSASVFVKVEGETFTWSVADENGEPIDGVTIADGVLSVADGVTASKAVIKYASTTDELKYAVKEVTINDYAAVKSFDIEGPAAVATGDTAAYAPVNVVDEYGDTITNMPVSFALTASSSIASIDAKTGTLTTTGSGNVTVAVTVGNPGKTLTKTYDVLVAQFYYINNNVTANSVTVDVTAINNYSATTEYNVTTAKDGVQISSYTTTAANGKITVDTTGATAVEVSPIYSYTSVGDITAASPLTVPLADGRYDFTFVKGNTTRGDIYVNGVIVGNNVDQDGNGRTKASGGTWNVSDVKVSGGSAVIYMQDNTSNMSSVTFKKAPSIVTRKQHLYILGDSLVANYFGDPVSKGTDGNPAAGTAQTGWGQVLDGFIRDDINVTNLAESGNYCQGLYETVFKTVLANAEEGDVLLFECGYNDRNYPASLGSDSARYANMQNYMELVYNEAVAKGINLCFVTPNISTHGTGWKESVQGTGSVIAKCEELGCKYINLSGLSWQYATDNYITPLGETAAKTFWAANMNVSDSLHSTYLGAMLMADIVANAMYDTEDLKSLVDTAAAFTLYDTNGEAITLSIQ